MFVSMSRSLKQFRWVTQFSSAHANTSPTYPLTLFGQAVAVRGDLAMVGGPSPRASCLRSLDGVTLAGGSLGRQRRCRGGLLVGLGARCGAEPLG